MSISIKKFLSVLALIFAIILFIIYKLSDTIPSDIPHSVSDSYTDNKPFNPPQNQPQNPKIILPINIEGFNLLNDDKNFYLYNIDNNLNNYTDTNLNNYIKNLILFFWDTENILDKNIDIIDKDGNFECYYRCLPINSKFTEPPVWQSAIDNKIALTSMYKDNNIYVKFVKNLFNEFYISAIRVLTSHYNMNNNDVVLLILIKFVQIKNPTDILFYKPGTDVNIVIKIRYNELPEYLTDKWIGETLFRKLLNYSLN